MHADRWELIEQLCQEALDRPKEQQEVFLESACGQDQELRREVESLLAHRWQAENFIEAPAMELAARAVAADQHGSTPGTSRQIGRLISHYRIVEEVASGGMGDVYRAVRADGTYDKQVAIKLIQGARSTDFFLARFQNERQILADLDHPNIARLLDGGTTEEGLPYVVMEYIQGLPIDEFCEQKSLTVRERLEVFRTVCSAVHYAHQNLVVHRDLKPGNILVTADGVPKLLDFGIAKMLNPHRGELPLQQTVTVMRMLTPDYASPEQLRNEPISTASDIYSLGVILYELLTGLSPYRLASDSPQELMKAICDTQPEKPSASVMLRPATEGASLEQPSSFGSSTRPMAEKRGKLRKVLAGDLDNIVLNALRKEPQRRYSSAEQFSEDIRRYLVGLPVVAHEDSMSYRARKFVARHKLGVAAVLLLVASLAGGLVGTLWQAHVAKLERARAERRFNDVRKIANSLMFEVHDSIKDLPGATPARRVLVDRALEYLDSLAQEAKGDLALQRELAAAYDRVGDLLGYNGAANLGDLPGALRSYKKALTIRELSASSFPDDVQTQSDLCGDYFRLGFVLQDAGDYTGALSNLHNAIPVAQKLADTHTDPKYRDILAGMYWKTAEVLVASGDGARALENYQSAFAIREPAANAANANLWTRIHHAGDYISLGTILGRTGDIGRSREYSERGTQLLEQLSKSDPANATLQEYLGEAYDLFASVLTQQGEVADALSYSRKSNKVFTRLLSADPANALAKDNLAITRTRTADLLIQLGRVDEALPTIKGAIASFEGIEHKNRYQVAGQASAYSTLAAAFVSLAGREASPPEKAAHLRSARSWYQKSLQTWQVYRGLSYGGNLAGDQSESVARQLAKCEAALARLQNRRPPSGQSSASQH